MQIDSMIVCYLAERVDVQYVAVAHDEVQGHHFVQRDSHQLVGEELPSRLVERFVRSQIVMSERKPFTPETTTNNNLRADKVRN